MKLMMIVMMMACCFICLCAWAQVKKAKPIYLCGDSKELFGEDSVTIYVWEHFISENQARNTPHKTFQKASEQGRFTIAVSGMEGPVYFTLSTGKDQVNKRTLLYLFIAEPGDSVTIRGNQNQLLFKGRGADKYRFRYQLENEVSSYKKGLPWLDYYRNKAAVKYLAYLHIWYDEYEQQERTQLRELKAEKQTLTPTVYQLLEADIRGYWQEKRANSYQQLRKELIVKLPADSLHGIPDSLDALFNKAAGKWQNATPETVLACSRNYVKGQLLVLKILAEKRGTPIEALIRSQFKGLLRDQLLTSYLMDAFYDIKAADDLLEQVLSEVKTGYCRDALKILKEKNGRGAIAPAFFLEDATGNWKNLKDYLGKVVVLDMWYTGCFGCIQLYQNTLKEMEAQYSKDTGVVFITVSMDADREKWKKSIETGNYTGTDAINLNAGPEGSESAVAKEYGVYMYPAIMVIDQEGKMYSRSYLLRDKENLIQAIDHLQTQYR